jgi:hypothetical protein
MHERDSKIGHDMYTRQGWVRAGYLVLRAVMRLLGGGGGVMAVWWWRRLSLLAAAWRRGLCGHVWVWPGQATEVVVEVVPFGMAAMLLSSVPLSSVLSSRPRVGDHSETTRMTQYHRGASPDPHIACDYSVGITLPLSRKSSPHR